MKVKNQVRNADVKSGSGTRFRAGPRSLEQHFIWELSGIGLLIVSKSAPPALERMLAMGRSQRAAMGGRPGVWRG